MFADISGFTALTEKLSKRGRIGAEEIVETLNRVFGGMLELAFDRGADLLKFGGDALLLMFRGDGHAERACDAAVEMRIALASGRRGADVGRAPAPEDVRRHPLRRDPPLPGRRADPRTGRSRPGRHRHRGCGEGRERGGDHRDRGHGRSGSVREPPGLGEDGASAPSPSATPSSRRLPTAHQRDIDAARLAHPVPPHARARTSTRVHPEPEHRLATIGFIRMAGTDQLLAESRSGRSSRRPRTPW